VTADSGRREPIIESTISGAKPQPSVSCLPAMHRQHEYRPHANPLTCAISRCTQASTAASTACSRANSSR